MQPASLQPGEDGGPLQQLGLRASVRSQSLTLVALQDEN